MNFSSIKILLILSYILTKLLDLISSRVLLILYYYTTKLLDLISSGVLLILSNKSIIGHLVNAFIILRLYLKALRFINT